MAKEYRLLDDILPYETEATINLSLKFGINTARLGNLLTPDKVRLTLIEINLLSDI